MNQYTNYNKTSYQKPQPDWDAINGQKRLEIIKGQTANQLVGILIARMQKQGIDYKDFNEFLQEYEKQFPRLLEVNKRLLIEGGKND